MLIAAVPLITTIPALAAVAILTALLTALITYETNMYGEARDRVRHENWDPGAPAA